MLDNSTKRHVKLDSGLSRAELEAYIQSQLDGVSEYDPFEIYVSKYDKSQDESSGPCILQHLGHLCPHNQKETCPKYQLGPIFISIKHS